MTTATKMTSIIDRMCKSVKYPTMDTIMDMACEATNCWVAVQTKEPNQAQMNAKISAYAKRIKSKLKNLGKY